MPDQPIPDVTDEDVRRIALRDFGEAELAIVWSLLEEYGRQVWNRPSPRVRAAILKLANGDLERLREALDIAIRDYRDVLAAAEYPRYNREVFGNVDEATLQNVTDQDWNQYSEWFSADRRPTE
jgi:hypothetical protein